MSNDLDKLFDGAEGSHVGVVMFTDNYRNDPKALLELAALIVLDKPLYLIVEYGAILPEKVRAICDGLAFHDGTQEGWAKATGEVMEMAKSAGHLPS